MSIEIRNISKSFGAFAAVRDVSLKVETGELLALLGPSGSGKTTLLRIIAGLEAPDPGSGPILFADEDVVRRHVRERKVGFVFQHYALFRHMTVFENVAFGLAVQPRRSRPSKAEIADRVHRLLRLVQLDGMAHRYPNQLSGGQRQRVALARALAVEPSVLLLDEPFGALDAQVRQELRVWLRRLHDEIHVTSVFVTHDQDEALEVADRVVVMNAGRIEQVGTPDEVFHHPTTEFVMGFIGQVNCFHGRIEAGHLSIPGLELDAAAIHGSASGEALVYVRPHDLDLVLVPDGHRSLRAHVEHANSAGPVVRLNLTTDTGDQIIAELGQERFRSLAIGTGSTVYVTPRELHVFDDEHGMSWR